ncbi:unnamed protein product [Somion occarium]|uniref:Uncharacterized protein n=1 Tax=Somion occarium TaxID=3059160 RepID=A0ABP1DRC2_9APHY
MLTLDGQRVQLPIRHCTFHDLIHSLPSPPPAQSLLSLDDPLWNDLLNLCLQSLQKHRFPPFRIKSLRHLFHLFLTFFQSATLRDNL